MIVVDASLAAKWLLDEEDSDRALAFLRDRESEICGPDVLATEVCRALVAACNSRRVDRQRAQMLIAAWLVKVADGGLRLHQLDARLIGTGARIALDLGHPLADCLYLALALDIGADLATSDVRFHARAHRLYPNVKLLADYGK